MDQPLVSVITNCFNGSSYLEEAIDSVLNQTYHNWELIFWDNCSTDSSAEIFKLFKDDRLKYFRAETYTHLGQARNFAISKASGELIAFLDCDDLWESMKLEKQVPKFIDPRVGIVTSNTYFFKNSGEKWHLYNKKNRPKGGDVFRSLLVEYNLSLETILVRKEALNSLKYLFQDDLEVAEEFDLLIRIAKNWNLEYVDHPLSSWRIHGESWTTKRPELFPRELRLILEKYTKEYSNFKVTYAKEINLLNRSIDYQECIVLWMQGNHQDARKKIAPHIFSKKKYILIYIALFLINYKSYSYLSTIRDIYLRRKLQ